MSIVHQAQRFAGGHAVGAQGVEDLAGQHLGAGIGIARLERGVERDGTERGHVPRLPRGLRLNPGPGGERAGGGPGTRGIRGPQTVARVRPARSARAGWCSVRHPDRRRRRPPDRGHRDRRSAARRRTARPPGRLRPDRRDRGPAPRRRPWSSLIACPSAPCSVRLPAYPATTRAKRRGAAAGLPGRDRGTPPPHPDRGGDHGRPTRRRHGARSDDRAGGRGRRRVRAQRRRLRGRCHRRHGSDRQRRAGARCRAAGRRSGTGRPRPKRTGWKPTTAGAPTPRTRTHYPVRPGAGGGAVDATRPASPQGWRTTLIAPSCLAWNVA